MIEEPKSISDIPCTICGKPSTTFKRDIEEREPRDGEDPAFKYFEAVGEVRFGCDQHPA